MIDYNTILSTTDSKVTLMQWLQTLTKEFENAQITDVTFTNDSNKSLTFTFKLEDGTTKTATIELHSLTADEQSLINNLIKSVTASSDGVTFSQAVSFQGNESHNGNEIHNGYSSFLGDENHAGSELHKGEATFTQLKADDITATDGQELMSWDGTTTALKGKADRPTYNGGDLALKNDVNAVSDIFVIADGDWSSKMKGANNVPASVFDLTGHNLYVYDSGKCTNLDHAFSHLFSFIGDLNEFHFVGGKNVTSFYLAFSQLWNYYDFKAYDRKCYFDIDASSTKNFSTAFWGCPWKKIEKFNLTNVQAGTNGDAIFGDNVFLTEIPAFDMGNFSSLSRTFTPDTSVTSFLAYGAKVSFDLSSCTKLDQAALRVVIDNLADVTELGTSPTLTLGSTLLAKLTADDITTANNKGWNLA